MSRSRHVSSRAFGSSIEGIVVLTTVYTKDMGTAQLATASVEHCEWIAISNGCIEKNYRPPPMPEVIDMYKSDENIVGRKAANGDLFISHVGCIFVTYDSAAASASDTMKKCTFHCLHFLKEASNRANSVRANGHRSIGESNPSPHQRPMLLPNYLVLDIRGNVVLVHTFTAGHPRFVECLVLMGHLGQPARQSSRILGETCELHLTTTRIHGRY